MNLLVPWAEWVALIVPHAPFGKTGVAPFAVTTMPRIHFMQQWFGLSALHGSHALWELYPEADPLVPDYHFSTLLLTTIKATPARQSLLLKAGIVIDATLVAVPGAIRDSTGELDPEMRQTKTANLWRFVMKRRIGVDTDCGLFYTVLGSAANFHDVTQENGRW
jgi:IS5 family transposase